MWKMLIPFLILGLVILTSGCLQDGTFGEIPQYNVSSTLEERLDNVKIKPEYKVKNSFGYCSSGGCRNWNVSYGIENEEYISCGGNYDFGGMGDSINVKCSLEELEKGEYPFKLEEVSYVFKTMSDVIKVIKSSDSSNTTSIEIGDRVCFYNMKNENFKKTTVCFDSENTIVNYAAGVSYGGGEILWEVEGYPYTDEIIALIE